MERRDRDAVESAERRGDMTACMSFGTGVPSFCGSIYARIKRCRVVGEESFGGGR